MSIVVEDIVPSDPARGINQVDVLVTSIGPGFDNSFVLPLIVVVDVAIGARPSPECEDKDRSTRVKLPQFGQELGIDLDEIIIGHIVRCVVGTCVYHDVRGLGDFAAKVPWCGIIVVSSPEEARIFGLEELIRQSMRVTIRLHVSQSCTRLSINSMFCLEMLADKERPCFVDTLVEVLTRR